MLDTETKKRIDTARDILVGKVPDPKSQVEQITIALVYKFMDDMDKESVEMGGQASFFSGDYERYAWSVERKGKQKWEMVRLREVGELKYGFTASAEEQGTARFIRITDISENGLLIKTEPKYTNISDNNIDYLLKKGDLLVARTGSTYGKTLLFNENLKAIYASYLIRIRFLNENIIPDYYWAFSQSENYWIQARSLMTGGGQPQFNGNALKEISFPLPPLEIQQEIVAEIEAERKAVDGCRELIKIYEEKIKRGIDRVWEE
ncbi:MAG: restriction endonuclease subunit S [Desulfamplus sp.]|nr:restriction endonuclease subunit S [Desulfamplus sp.]MBF0389254.1 restriction endonuclease subunit S [Desulfamplus sp.]